MSPETKKLMWSCLPEVRRLSEQASERVGRSRGEVQGGEREQGREREQGAWRDQKDAQNQTERTETKTQTKRVSQRHNEDGEKQKQE